MRGVWAMLVLTTLCCAKRGDEPLPEDPNPTESLAGAHYTGHVKIDVVTASLDALLSITLREVETSEVAFLLNRGLEIKSLQGDGVEDFSVQTSAMTADWNEITVKLEPSRSGGPIEIEVAYGGIPIFPENGINQISERWVELSVDSAWHPLVADLDRELTTQLELELPTGWDVVSSGHARSIAGGYDLDVELPQVDIAFVAAPDLKAESQGHYGIYHREVPEETLRAVLATAEACRAFLDRRFGSKRRLPQGQFVVASRSEGGYARKNYIVLTNVEKMNDEDLTTFLCHELAHFWSAGARPLTVENWLNEGFAEFIATQAARDIVGEATYTRALEDWTRRSSGQTSIWTSTDASRRPFAVNYKKAPLALSRLEAKIGKEAFEEVLVRYMADPINQTTTLLDAVEEAAGPESRTWFEEVLAEDETAE